MDLFVKTTHAATVVDSNALAGVLNPIINNVVYPIVDLAFVLAVVVFVYGVVKMIVNASDSEQHTKGKLSMFYGIIGMFVMVSAWGIIHLVANTVMQFN